ncbi:MAG: UDP-N-acetylmuramoyl-tripeptide--D-alanyl-D-alanine ligase [Roseobacter sp.]
MTLWTAQDAQAATGGQTAGGWFVSGISIDTRTLVPGDLFVALKDVRDGHDFVAQAFEKGASAALVSRIPYGVAWDAPLLMVPDVFAALEALGRAGRDRMTGKVVGVTGSVGKTSTKEMLVAMLSDQGATHASVASYNNHWGVPLTLARMPPQTDYAIIEIGMNQPGEIAPLARMAKPHVGFITNVAPAHLEAFENIEGIAREKASILDGVLAGGVAVLNADIDTADILDDKAQACKLTTLHFGAQVPDFKMLRADIRDQTTVVQADMSGSSLLFKLASPGRHFAMNALGALAVVSALEADIALAVASLGRWRPYKGRGQRERIYLDAVETNMTLDLIDDSYNANPTSMAAALEVLAAAEVTNDIGRVSKGRRIAYLGDMKELGAQEGALHAALAQLSAVQHIDKVHCIGPLMRALYDALPEAKRGMWSMTTKEMLPAVPRQLDSGDVVLAKGSLSMGLGQVVDAIRKMGHAPLDDA